MRLIHGLEDGKAVRLRIGLTLLIPLLLLVFLGPLFLLDPLQMDIRSRHATPFANWEHPLGTDLLGRDTIARLAYGLRLTFITSMISLATAIIVGALPGLLILSRLPKNAPAIVKTLTMIIVLFWVFTVIISFNAIYFQITDVFEWWVELINILSILGAAMVLIALRKKSSFLPEVPERTRWTTIGWRMLRMLLVGPMLLFSTITIIYLLPNIRETLPTSVIIGVSVGLTMAPFTLRTTLAAGQPTLAGKAINLGLFSAIAWAILGATYLGIVGLGQPPDTPDIGRLIFDGQTNPVAPLLFAALALFITISGLVLTGDGIRDRLHSQL